MTGYDILLLLVIVGYIGYTVYKKKKKKKKDLPVTNSNYALLRQNQTENKLHGVSIVSLYYDSVSSYKDMEKDGSVNNDFDLQCETAVNNIIYALLADGHNPKINALSCVDRVIFYITY